jgi:hypothetical protein
MLERLFSLLAVLMSCSVTATFKRSAGFKIHSVLPRKAVLQHLIADGWVHVLQDELSRRHHNAAEH